jgi:tRNA 2-thiouridine synthesizing protein E
MTFLDLKSGKVSVDVDGFLLKPDDWTPDMAHELANIEGVHLLEEKHWIVINFLRKYYKSHGMAPKIRILCKDTGFSLPEIYRLFPSGPAKGACKVAGLPKPTGCV